MTPLAKGRDTRDGTCAVTDVGVLASEFPRCPICDGTLRGEGEPYRLEELLSMWAPVRFSRATEEELRGQSGFSRLYTCGVCGLGIFFPQIIGTPGFYDALQGNSQTSYYVDDKWEFQEALRDAQGADSIVEVGCGPGHFLRKVSSRVRRVAGVEYNERAIRAARELGHPVFRTVRDVLDRIGPVDAVFAFHVLEHVPDPVDFLRSLLAVTRPGGKVGLSVPNMDGPVRFVNPCASNMPPHHASHWREKTLRALSRRLGLRIERIACEPLTAPHAYYYTLHWARHVSRGHSSVYRVASRGAQTFFNLYFRMFVSPGTTSLRFFVGQSLYVLMTKVES